jgi:hypothetical protein
MANSLFKCIYLFLLISFFMSCKSQDDNACTVNDGKQIEHTTEIDSKGKESSFSYVYNAQNQLDSIVGDANNLQLRVLKYNAQKQLVEITQFGNIIQKPEKSRIDSLSYDANNRLFKVREFSENNGLGLYKITTYTYNAQDKAEKEIIIVQNDTSRIKIHEWEGDNIIKTTEFDKAKIKLTELTFKYDTKNNPFYAPFYSYNGINSRNNLLEMVSKDFTGVSNPSVNTFTLKYTYNSSNFPTVQTTNGLYKYTYCYK